MLAQCFNTCQAFFQKKCKKTKKVESFFDFNIVFLHLLIQRKANMEIDDFVNQKIQSKLQTINKRDYFIIQRRCRVAGLFYHMDEYLEYLNEEEEDLFAIFEPNNPYDKNAIAIYGGDHFIGYVPRDIAEYIAELPYSIRKDIILDLRYRNKKKCIYSIMFPQKHYNAIQSIYDNLQSNYLQKSTFSEKIIKWIGLDEIEYNTTFKLFLGVISIALLFILFMICAVNN
jgi:hypothetical protein